MTSPPIRRFETPHGTVDLRPARAADVERVAPHWPFPILTLPARGTPEARAVDHVLPFEYGDAHVQLLGWQLPPEPWERARARVGALRTWAQGVVVGCIRNRVEAVAIPLVTLRRNHDVGAPGVALVVGPAHPGDDVLTGHDPVDVFERAGARERLDPVGPLKPTTPAAVGQVFLDLGWIGREVVCLQRDPHGDDPIWGRLAAAGIESALHLPVSRTSVRPSRADPSSRLDPALRPPKPPQQAAPISPNGKRRIYRMLVHLAACDGSIDPTEQAVLDQVAGQFALSEAERDVLTSEGRRAERLGLGTNPVERECAFELMLDVAAADGVLDVAERQRLVQLAERLGISRQELRRRIDARFGGRAATSRTAAKTSPEALRRIYRLLWYAAGSDGDVGDGEDTLLEDYRTWCGIDPAEAVQLRSEGLQGQQLQVGTDPKERALLLDRLIAVVAADRQLTPAERRRLKRLCQRLHVPPAELDACLRAHVRGMDSDVHSISGESAALPADGGGWIVFWDTPVPWVELDLRRIPIPRGFRGFHHVPAGLHRVGLELDGRELSRWVHVPAGGVVSLVLRDGTLRLAPADLAADVQRDAWAGLFDAHSKRAPESLTWAELTKPLHTRLRLPEVLPALEHVDAGSFARALDDDHDGDWSELLAEFSLAFLRGWLDDDDSAFQRWRTLVQALYQVGVDLPRRSPEGLVWIVHLLMAQQRQLPVAQLEGDPALTTGSYDLCEDLFDTRLPRLTEAGRRWAVFIAGHHPNAPAWDAPTRASGPVTVAQEDPRQRETREALERLEAEHGADSERLIPALSARVRALERAGRFSDAARHQARMTQLAVRLRASGLLVAQSYTKLARLYRDSGQRERALDAEQRAREASALASAQRPYPPTENAGRNPK